MLSYSRLVADVYAADGIRCNAVTPGPTATEAWTGDGGLADAAGRPRRGAREGRRRPAARPPRRAGRDRLGDRVSPVGSGRVRDGRGLVGRRRHRPDHHLTLALPWPCARCRRESRRRLRRADPRGRGARALAARRALVRDGGRPRRRGRVRRPDAVPARPRPHPPFEAVPAAEGQDAGLHRPGGRPLPHADDPHARDDRDRARRRARAAAERGPDRGDRARSRHRPPAVRARRREGARRAHRRVPPQRAVGEDRRAS